MLANALEGRIPVLCDPPLEALKLPLKDFRLPQALGHLQPPGFHSSYA